MTIQEALQLDISGKNILIIGCPASGKTYFSNLLDKTNHVFLHSDDYIQYGYEESLYKLMEDTKSKLTITEGVQGYRLLRKGVQLDCYYPDIVFEMIITDEQQNNIYSEERDPKKLKYMQSFKKTNQTVLDSYLSLENSNKPIWIRVENKFQ